MKNESEIVSEIKRQGKMTRWTLLLCFAALAFLIGVSSFGLGVTVRVGLSTIFLGMVAAFLIAILQSVAFQRKENTRIPPNSNNLKDNS